MPTFKAVMEKVAKEEARVSVRLLNAEKQVGTIGFVGDDYVVIKNKDDEQRLVPFAAIATVVPLDDVSFIFA